MIHDNTSTCKAAVHSAIAMSAADPEGTTARGPAPGLERSVVRLVVTFTHAFGRCSTRGRCARLGSARVTLKKKKRVRAYVYIFSFQRPR